ncbi:AAA family ATPase [Streptomyces sp. NPDC056534]|uniref:AAA family ATPase n=1 Tax=Streptomyces sp. NPDC056534 TaxID=3345857 RepID=UPI0036C20ABB
MRTGSEGTRLVFLRGNSGSGKSTVAGLVRERYGVRDMAVIGQDVVRRTVLKEKESGCSGHVTVGMVDVMARYALAAGFHVVVEGIYGARRYGEVLRALAADHVGVTAAFYFAVPFEETVRRHGTRTKAGSFGAAEMRSWWKPEDLIPGLDEALVGPELPAAETAALVLARVGLPDGGLVWPAAT